MCPSLNHSPDGLHAGAPIGRDTAPAMTQRRVEPTERRGFDDHGGVLVTHRGEDDGLVHNHRWAVTAR